MGKELNLPTPKPRRHLTRWWADILSSLSNALPLDGWRVRTELLSVRYERQREFERGVKTMLKEVKSKWHDPTHRNVCFLVAGAPNRRVKVMCVGVKNVTLQEQRETVTRAFNLAEETVSTSATLAIVKSASTKTYPYSPPSIFSRANPIRLRDVCGRGGGKFCAPCPFRRPSFVDILKRQQRLLKGDRMKSAETHDEPPLTSLPTIVSREEWQRARDQLLVKEKAATKGARCLVGGTAPVADGADREGLCLRGTERQSPGAPTSFPRSQSKALGTRAV